RRMSLISLRPLTGSTEQIEITHTRRSGAERGRGRLQSCLVRARSQTASHRFLLPGPTGTPAAVPPGTSDATTTLAAPGPTAAPAATSEPASAADSADPRWTTITHLRQVIGSVR